MGHHRAVAGGPGQHDAVPATEGEKQRRPRRTSVMDQATGMLPELVTNVTAVSVLSLGSSWMTAMAGWFQLVELKTKRSPSLRRKPLSLLPRPRYSMPCGLRPKLTATWLPGGRCLGQRQIDHADVAGDGRRPMRCSSAAWESGWPGSRPNGPEMFAVHQEVEPGSAFGRRGVVLGDEAVLPVPCLGLVDDRLGLRRRCDRSGRSPAGWVGPARAGLLPAPRA